MLYYQHYRRLPAWVRENIYRMARTVLRDATDGRLWRQRIRRFFEGGRLSFADCYMSFLTAVDHEYNRDMYQPKFLEHLDSLETMDFIRPYLERTNGIPELERLMYTDLKTYLPFNQLVYGDRMSMAHSLEVRVPFVDQRVIEVAGSISLRQKLADGATKGLFRKAMTTTLPREVIEAPKQGLNLPIAVWFRRELRDWIKSLLSPQRLCARGYFRPEAVENLLNEHLKGHRDHSLFLWALAVLEVWHQLYVD
jgi:asparagine synthase (glutamine-hydrolysing)